MYIDPPPRAQVICVDDMGPIAVKTYPGEERNSVVDTKNWTEKQLCLGGTCVRARDKPGCLELSQCQVTQQ